MNKMRTTFKILFFIKKHRTLRNGKSPIYLRVTYNGSQAEFGVKRSISETHWNQKSGRSNSNEQWAKELNLHLEYVQHQVYQAQVDLRLKQSFITAQAIKNRYLGTDQDNKTLIQVYSEHNRNLKSGIGITHSLSTY